MRSVGSRRIIDDTDPEVADRMFERWRQMSIAERAALIDRLCLEVEQLAIAGIRFERPDIDDAELRYELVRRRYGRELADAAYPR
jgi:hypothetical protein